jgi:O-acetyl-ADP-ribose deacetylase (regulator of RNase III)
MYGEVKGDLIELAKDGNFDVIAHGCNCFCTMGAGIAPLMARAFGCDKFPMESPQYRGNINKLGTIDAHKVDKYSLIVVNAYSQYHYGRNHQDGVASPIDYEALTLCMRKMNMRFKGKHIGLPKIGAGLAGGDWDRIKKIIQDEFTDCNVTVVIFE